MPTPPKITLPISGAVVSTSGDAFPEYLKAGLTPIPLHAAPGGACTCRKGIACDSPGKHPILKFKAFFDRRPTKADVREWATKWPDSNIALLGVEGLAVLDIDDHAVAKVVLEDARLKGALVVSTKRGAHIYLREKRASKSGPVCPGVDIKARGGMIVAPPSVIGDHVYKISQDGTPIEVENARECSESLLRELGIMPAESSSLSPTPKESEPTTTSGSGLIVAALRDLSPGNRNDTFTRITGALHRRGLSAGDIVALLGPSAERVDFPEDELTALVRGLCERYEAPGVARGPFATVSCGELLASVGSEPVSWDVDSLIASRSATILSGLPSCGKTWALLDLAIEVSRGGRWLGKFECAKGNVLYFDQESREALLSKRLRQLLAAKGIGSEGTALRLAVMAGVSLSDESAIARLRETLDEHKPRLVVIDSLIRVHAADENTASEMRVVSGVIQRLMLESGASFVFADHLRKARPGTESDPRGSNEKVAFVDQLLVMRRTAPEMAVLQHRKSRFATEVPPFEVRIHDPIPGRETLIAWVGEVSAREEVSHRATDRDAVHRALVDKAAWMSRLELVAAFKGRIPGKRLDETLKRLSERGLTEREDRPGPKGGTRRAWFRAKAAVVTDE